MRTSVRWRRKINRKRGNNIDQREDTNILLEDAGSNGNKSLPYLPALL